jgi:2-polyprenyl-3-methyl-5-hydroxy-6-metoxy-1,4-benzoquinol methylase
MNGASARLFAWVQGAAFYADVHRDAVALVGRTQGDWLDVGCGPGLVACLAADAGFTVTGIDRDPRMVREANRRARGRTITFDIGEVEDLEPAVADVVSATSLLATLPDPITGLHSLWNAVRPGGTLLIVEATASMTPEGVHAVAVRLPPHRRSALTWWARARHGRSLDPRVLDSILAERRTSTPLLHGLIDATVFTRSEPSQGRPAPRPRSGGSARAALRSPSLGHHTNRAAACDPSL